MGRRRTAVSAPPVVPMSPTPSDGDGVLVYMRPEVNRIKLTGELRGAATAAEALVPGFDRQRPLDPDRRQRWNPKGKTPAPDRILRLDLSLNSCYHQTS